MRVRRRRPAHGAAFSASRRHISIVAALCVVLIIALAPTIAAVAADVLLAVDAIPTHLAGRFRESRGFSRAADGHFLIFDRAARCSANL